MTDEYTLSMDFNLSSDEEQVDTTVSSKDERITAAVHENGYESECSSSSRSDQDVAISALEVETDAFTRFIERQRIEMMFELRNIRLGERPVTGQTNRERIETFLHTIQEQQQSQARAPSTRPAVPSAHINDIDALANRRCVSAALGSGAFRRDLENAVRQSIERRPSTPVQQIPQAPSVQRIPPPPPIPRTFGSMNIELTNVPPLRLHTTPVFQEQERRQITEIQTYEPFNVERQEREITAWQTITQLQRETIVLEISDLVHRQLVSSALESDFRQHLEQNILMRFAEGAPPQQGPVVTTARVPPTPAPIRRTTVTNVTSLTVDDLSSRLDGMQQTLKLMFSMQMDMQRSLRQEVASALANNSSSIMTSSSHPVNAGHCTVCLTTLADTVLYRCGHLCVCYTCGLNLRANTTPRGVKCPICRAPVDDILRVYRSSRDGE